VEHCSIQEVKQSLNLYFYFKISYQGRAKEFLPELTNILPELTHILSELKIINILIKQNIFISRKHFLKTDVIIIIVKLKKIHYYLKVND